MAAPSGPVVIVFFLDRPTALDVLYVVIGLLVVLGAIDFLDQPGQPDALRGRQPPPAAGGGPVMTG
jgi:hypothetical protein